VTYRTVEGNGLATRFDGAPRFTATTQGGGNSPTLRLEYYSALDAARLTHVDFTDVLWYQWTDEDFEIFNSNADDYEFGLIEITNSEQVQRWVHGRPGRSLPGVLKESDLHHYRLGFEEHGTYDVICTSLAIQVAGSRLPPTQPVR
jgi:hypothetical protein